MGKPDALSRRADHGTGGADNDNVTLLKPEFFAIRALEGITLVGAESEVLSDIRRNMQMGRHEDIVAKAITKLKTAKTTAPTSIRSSEWSLQDGLLLFRGRLYVPKDSELRRKIVELHHDSKIAGHPGRCKTLELVSRNYWWPQMSRFIGQYTSTCDACLWTKSISSPPVGELQPLPVPGARWSVVSVDFIVELPDSHGFDAILVVVDS